MILHTLFAQGIDRHRQGDLAGAEHLYRRILEQAPGHRDSLHMLAVVLAQQGRREEAAPLFDAVLEQNRHDPLALTNYANLLREMGRPDAALERLQAATALDGRDAERWHSLALTEQALGRLEEALASAARALALRPDHVGALRSRADLLLSLGAYREALAAYDRLLAAAPRDAALWNNRGLVLRNLGELEASSDAFRRAAALDPGLAAAPFNQGLNFLLTGDFARGLPLYELRKQLPQPVEARVYEQPLWTGKEDLLGKRLFVYVEQGLGDAIQFFRFIAMVQARGAAVTLSVHQSLIRLLHSADAACVMIGWGEVPADFDYHIPLMSLPLALGLDLSALPAPSRYLAAEPERLEYWRGRLGAKDFRIGLAWRGNKAVFGAEGKDFPLSALKCVSALAGVRLISLQKDAKPDEIPPGMSLERYPEMDQGEDAFLDSAAMIENLDLVISADTAMAHLAGALGRACWVALKRVPDWRWLLGREDSPWYPSLRLFRQKEPGNWADVFDAMCQRLAAEVAARPQN